MKKFLATVFLKIIGWKVTAQVKPAMARSVMLAAPHTSNWDFPIALAAFWYMGLDVKFFIKNDYTTGLFGGIFRWMGALGVDRSKKKNKLTDLAIQLLGEKDQLVIMVPAEGTRKAVDKWRTGFYRISMEAKVPISKGYLDYKKKEAGVGDPFMPTGNFEEDMTHIQEFYRPIHPKHPEGYNPEIF